MPRLEVQGMSRPSFAFMRDIIAAFCAQPGNMSGGSLGLVLEDGLFEYEWVQACRDYALKNNDPDGAFLASLLIQFSETERAEIIELESPKNA